MTSDSGKTSTILLTGASGYLGQHLLWYWMNEGLSTGSERVTVVAVYNQSESFSRAIQNTESKVQVLPVACNLTNPSSVDSLFHGYSFDVCIHTAAVSSPAICQQDPEKARKVNAPEYFIEKLKSVDQVVALSTDQVFDGTSNIPYQEDVDAPNPLNVYGQTKLAMEELLKQHPHCIILRSSIILGPKVPFGGAHDTFLHFCATRQGQETAFFTNEYRSVVSVRHVCHVLDFFITNAPTCSKIFHMGGPWRVNRLQLAQAVFDYMGFDSSVLIPAKQTAPTVPLDITMNSSRLEEFTKLIHEPKTLEAMVEYTLKTV